MTLIIGIKTLEGIVFKYDRLINEIGYSLGSLGTNERVTKSDYKDKVYSLDSSNILLGISGHTEDSDIERILSTFNDTVEAYQTIYQNEEIDYKELAEDFLSELKDNTYFKNHTLLLGFKDNESKYGLIKIDTQDNIVEVVDCACIGSGAFTEVSDYLRDKCTDRITTITEARRICDEGYSLAIHIDKSAKYGKQHLDGEGVQVLR